jgi:hypothetical protein
MEMEVGVPGHGDGARDGETVREPDREQDSWRSGRSYCRFYRRSYEHETGKRPEPSKHDRAFTR